jgi:hypothetical protein
MQKYIIEIGLGDIFICKKNTIQKTRILNGVFNFFCKYNG